MMIKIILLLVLAAVKGNKLDNIKSEISYENDTVRLHCVDEDVTLDKIDQFTAFKETITAKRIIIDSCVPPSDRYYADILKTLNVNVEEIKVLYIVNPPRTENHFNARNEDRPDPRRPKKEHFIGLDIEELQILNDDIPAALGIELSFLLDLMKLKKLVLHNLDIFGPFPNTSKLQTVEISGGVLYGDIGACSGFKVLHLDDIELFGGKEEYFDGLLKDCKQLVELKLERMDKQTCKTSLLRHLSRTLRKLTVRHCGITEVPASFVLFPDSDSLIGGYNEKTDDYLLTHLDLSYNSLKDGHYVHTHKSLITVDLSHNDLNNGNGLYYLPNVTDFKLDYNNFENYCNLSLWSRRRPKDEYLRTIKFNRLTITNAGMRELCFDSMQLSTLKLLNLTNNNIAVLDYRQLFNVSNHQIEVDLRNNPLEKVELNQEDYEALKRNDSSVAYWRNITILTQARLTCNCTHAWLGRALRENLLTIEGATCIDGLSLELPRLSYALHGCAEACAGADGCSAANTIYNIRKNKDKFISIFTEQTSLWWICHKIYELIVGY